MVIKSCDSNIFQNFLYMDFLFLNILSFYCFKQSNHQLKDFLVEESWRDIISGEEVKKNDGTDVEKGILWQGRNIWIYR